MVQQRQNWTEQMSPRIVQLLDQAISRVGRQAFDGLAGPNARGAWYPINGAFLQLRRLIDGDMPVYDAWSALFYLLWYQTKQINVAYRAIQARRRDDTLTDNGRLHIIDFGCGALAFQFGTSLAIADALQRGENITYVRVDSIDTCDEMLRLGRHTWELFCESLGNEPQLGPLRHACELIEWNAQVAFADDELIQNVHRQENAEIWLSALHFVYHENIPNVLESLRTMINRYRPDVGFLTSVDFKEDLVDLAWEEFANQAYERSGLANWDLQRGLIGPLPETTAYRVEVAEMYPRLWESTVNLLMGQVDCEPQPTTYVICTNRVG